MLSLSDEEAVQKAVDTLSALQPVLHSYLESTDFKLNIKGVDHFTSGRDRQTRVLFGKVDRDENYTILEDLADIIIQQFIKDGVVDPKDFDHIKYDKYKQKYTLKFHLTLLNTKYQRVNGRMIGFDGQGKLLLVSTFNLSKCRNRR